MRQREHVRRTSGVLVGFVTGGEPLNGCEPIATLIAAASRDEMLQRARQLGIWDPGFVPGVRIKRQHAAMAIEDPQRFIWLPAGAKDWQPSRTWPGTE